MSRFNAYGPMRVRHKKGATATTTAFATEDTKITKDGNGNGENLVTANGQQQEPAYRRQVLCELCGKSRCRYPFVLDASFLCRSRPMPRPHFQLAQRAASDTISDTAWIS